MKSIHVSIFVSVEFPDEDLITILEQYGELKSRQLRRLHFNEEGYTHIERGVRVAEFIKITRDIPKKIVLSGIEVGFKYSGQPATCYRCQSMEHMVKDCPKRRRPVLGRDENLTEGEAPGDEVAQYGKGMDTATPPPLFTQSRATLSYADAAALTSTATTNDDNSEAGAESAARFDAALREEHEQLEHQIATKGRKHVPPAFGK